MSTENLVTLLLNLYPDDFEIHQIPAQRPAGWQVTDLHSLQQLFLH